MLKSLTQLLFCAVIFAESIFWSFNVFGSVTNSPADDAKIGNWLREHRGDIVIIKGKGGAGSGFIYTLADRRFLVSNIHVMAGVRSPTFTTLDRSLLKLKPNSAVVAAGHDIIMMELLSTNSGIARVESFGDAVTVNDTIVVIGNSGGGDVATAINGRVVGVGVNRIEIDAEIELGNSGSPIVHVPTQKVIGVATYITTYDLISGKKKERRFGYRLDTVKQWEAVDWARFYSEADKLENVVATTRELRRALSEVNDLNDRTNKFRVYSYESPTIRKALDDFYSAYAQKKSRLDAERAAANLLQTLKGASQSYPTSAKPYFTYDYFRREFNDQDKDRTEVIITLAKILQM